MNESRITSYLKRTMKNIDRIIDLTISDKGNSSERFFVLEELLGTLDLIQEGFFFLFFF